LRKFEGGRLIKIYMMSNPKIKDENYCSKGFCDQ
jgi:hypothetical protein